MSRLLSDCCLTVAQTVVCSLTVAQNGSAVIAATSHQGHGLVSTFSLRVVEVKEGNANALPTLQNGGKVGRNRLCRGPRFARGADRRGLKSRDLSLQTLHPPVTDLRTTPGATALRADAPPSVPAGDIIVDMDVMDVGTRRRPSSWKGGELLQNELPVRRCWSSNHDQRNTTNGSRRCHHCTRHPVGILMHLVAGVIAAHRSVSLRSFTY